MSGGCPVRTVDPGPVAAGAPTVLKARSGTVTAAFTTEAGAGVVAAAVAVGVGAESRAIFTTSRTITITRMRTTKAHVTSAIGARRVGTTSAEPSAGMAESAGPSAGMAESAGPSA